MRSVWFALGSAAGAIGVALGAFAAHGLRDRLDPEMLAVFETGVRYQLFHALALLGAGVVADRRPGALVTAAGVSFAAGIVLFSGSLCLLAVTGARWLGAITPVGGVAFVVGWIVLGVAAVRGR